MTGTIVYDGDCGFCTTSAHWIEKPGRVEVTPWQRTDLAAVGLTAERADAAVQWVEDGRLVDSGAGAIGHALRARGGVGRIVGRLVLVRRLRPVADHAYDWLARHRHQLPGGTPACRL